MKKVALAFAFLFFISACDDKKAHTQAETENIEDSVKQECELKVFGAVPPLSVLLEILYPQGMIGLNYKPYEEDIAFMPETVADLPVLGHSGKSSLNFEEIAKYKPDVIFFSNDTLEEVILPYEQIGIESVRVKAFDYEDYASSIQAITQILSKNEACESLIKPRGEKLVEFIKQSDEILQTLDAKLKSKEEQEDTSLRPSVYFALGFDGLKTQCGDDGDLAYRIGGKNAVSCKLFSDSPLQFAQMGVDFELLAKVNPEVIFVREIAFFKELVENPSPKWQTIDAIKNKRVYYAPSTPSNWLINPPSILRSVGLVWAYSRIHPNLVSDEEVKELAQKFYTLFLRDLGDEDYQALQGL